MTWLERLASNLRLRPRLALVSLLASIVSAGVVAVPVEHGLYSGIEERFERDLDRANREVETAWAALSASLPSAVDDAGKAFGGILIEEARMKRADREGASGPGAASHFVFARTVSTLGGGEEFVGLDRRETTAEWYFSGRIPREDRDRIRSRISVVGPAGSAFLRAPTRLTPSSSLVLLAGEGMDPRLYLVSGSELLPEWGEVAVLIPVDATVLNELHIKIGCHLVLQAAGARPVPLASSLEDGHAVVEAPAPSIWQGRYLARRLGAPGDDVDIWRLANNLLFTSFSNENNSVISPVETIRARILTRPDWLSICGGLEGIDRIVKYTRTRIALPRDRDRRNLGSSLDLAEALRKTLPEADAAALARKSNFVRILYTVFPPGLGGTPDLAGRADLTGEWTPAMTAALESEFDWRPRETLHPLNLWTASSEEIRKFLADLSIENSAQVAGALEGFRGPRGEAYASAKLGAIAGLSAGDAEILAGTIFREDPAPWLEVRAALARPVSAGQTLTIGGTEYVAAHPLDVGGGVELIALVDRAEFMAEVRTLHLIGYGTIGIVFALFFVSFQVVGVTIIGPIRRVEEAMRRVEGGDFSAQLEVVGRDEFSGIADRFNRMVAGLRERMQLEAAFRRYVPAAVVREASRQGDSARLGGAVRTCSIMFADIRGFTDASLRLPAVDVVRLLNLYYEPAVEEILASEGTVDKFIGDSILAVWGAPDPVEDYADRAVRSAVRIQERVLAMNQEREARGDVALYFGIGIATGEVLAGHVGTQERADWTVIGSEVNLAQRISSVALPYRVLVSEKTSFALRDRTGLVFRPMDTILLKGFEHPVRVQTLLWFNGHSGPPVEEDKAVDNNADS